MKKYVLLAAVLTQAAFARTPSCEDLPKYKEFKEAVVAARQEKNGGFDLDMWATLVDRSGIICAVVFTGKEYGDQWPGSRVISAQKANTANAFSLPAMAFSTANIYSAAQPGGFMYAIEESNPVDVKVAYAGKSDKFGMEKDPMVGQYMGGVSVFGGGLALYSAKGEILGAIGLSGDSSCADQNIAWRTRHNLKLDFVPKGNSPEKDDNIMYLGVTEKPNKFKHPMCGNTEHSIKLPKVSKTP